MRITTVVFVVGCVGTLAAQSPPTLPGCEPRIEVRQAIDEKLADKSLQQMKFVERVAFRRRVLEELIAQYPREVEPYRILIRVTKDDETDRYPDLVERLQKEAGQHPADPLAQYTAGLALSGRNTPLSIEYLERARSEAPTFAWPALELAHIYSPGTKRVDKKKAAEEAADFFAACPSSSDADAQRRLTTVGTPELQARVAAALRARLATETEIHRLKDYATLWGLEFRAHPPAEHDALRKQVAADLKRLEAANPNPDAAWLVFLKDGYKQSGAPPETVAAMEDRVIEAFPHSEEAFRIVNDRWDKLHKEPEDGGDRAAWAKYHAEYRQALKEWMARFTESRELQHGAWFDTMSYDPDLPAEEGLRLLDDYLANMAPYEPPVFGMDRAANFLISHKWQPRRVFEILAGVDKLRDEWQARFLGDNLSAEAEDVWSSNDIIRRQEAVGNLLVAARLAEQPQQAARLKPFVERDLPAKSWPTIQWQYWLNRARLAALEGSKADALAYYQKGLQSRKKPPNPYEGQDIDDLRDEARALWKDLGGSETAWNLWSQPPAAKVQELAESGWRKPAKDMPAFELADLAGKTWRLNDLGGRAVLINVWATWCGPCQHELPHLEKLYEKVKDRADLQILTLTIDTDLGAVAPYMKEKGYTFPVLPAAGFVNSLLDIVGIPQNWILDAKGVWRWTGAPAVPDAEWEDAMLRQLESAR